MTDTKEAARRTRVTMKLGDHDVVFRIPQLPDIWAVKEGLPDVDYSDEQKALEELNEQLAEDPKTLARSIAVADKLLHLTAIAPKLLLESVHPVPAGALCLPEIDFVTRISAFSQLMDESGLELGGDAARGFSETAGA